MRIFGKPVPSLLVSLALGAVWSGVASIPALGAPMLGWINHSLFAMGTFCTLIGIASVHLAVNGLRKGSVARRARLLRIMIGCGAVVILLLLGWIAHLAWLDPIVSKGPAMFYIFYTLIIAALIGSGREAYTMFRAETVRNSDGKPKRGSAE